MEYSIDGIGLCFPSRRTVFDEHYSLRCKIRWDLNIVSVSATLTIIHSKKYKLFVHSTEDGAQRTLSW